MQPGRALVFDVDIAIADPGIEPLGETGPFGKRIQRIDYGPVEQPEIADIALDGNVGGSVVELVEQPGSRALEPGILAPAGAYAVDDLGAFEPGINHGGNDFRRILQVHVHRNHGIALNMAQPCRQSGLLAEAARQANELDGRIAFAGRDRDGSRAVGTAVIDEDDLVRTSAKPVAAHRLQNRHSTFEERGDRVFLVEDRHDDRKGW